MSQLQDTFKHKGLRRQLIQSLREKGIENERVLAAMDDLPRHSFMDNAFLQFAYEDKAFPIGAGQTISQPYTVAFQSTLLEVEKGHKVLEIGTGSGYQTAVLMNLGAKVYTVERQRPLYDTVRVMLPKLNFRPKFFYGDGYKGLPPFAPFDRVLVTAGAPFIPEALKEQLKVGGLLVIPVGDGDVQRMYRLRKISETEFEEQEYGDFKFVPLLTNRE